VIIKSMAERKDIDFEAHTPSSAVITGDENMLVTVVRNLLTNAVKFTGAGGKVSLQITECNSKYIVAVSDTGVGMSPEQLQNLFRIDRQHLRKGTAGEQSSGLGLIVCKEMLEKNGSRLNVESEEGKGSRFWFEI
jgi:signal transduction histidine kinase